MRDLARSAILDALRVGGQPAAKVGVPYDRNQELRSAGNWRPFTTGLREIAAVERSELNVAACHTKLETKISKTLDASRHVVAFVRNHGPERVEIPYKYKGAGPSTFQISSSGATQRAVPPLTSLSKEKGARTSEANTRLGGRITGGSPVRTLLAETRGSAGGGAKSDRKTISKMRSHPRSGRR